MRDEVSAFRINIGFGTALYNPIHQQFRYFYCSTNQYLFDRADTISTRADMDNFFQKILDINIKNRYYCQRPGSGWILAAMPNVEIKIMRLRGIPIGTGEGVELPAFIKNSRSVISLTHHYNRKNAFADNPKKLDIITKISLLSWINDSRK